MAVLAG